MIDFAQTRRNMVDGQLRTYDITDQSVLTAMGRVPREHFVPPGREMIAYTDQYVIVGDAGVEGPRFMLAPMVFARMLQHAQVRPGMRVLDVASGLGYSAAVLAEIGAEVVALESSEALGEETRRKLRALGEPRIEVVTGPLQEGHPAGAPYDVIVINGCIQARPQALLEQLVDEGRLVCIEGDGSRTSRATLYVRSGALFGDRPLFDAAAPVLPAFKVEPGFVF